MSEVLSLEDRIRAAHDIAACHRLQYWALRLLDAVHRLEADRAVRERREHIPGQGLVIRHRVPAM